MQRGFTESVIIVVQTITTSMYSRVYIMYTVRILKRK